MLIFYLSQASSDQSKIDTSLVFYVDFAVGDMPKSPSSQYGLKAQVDIDPRGIRVTNGPMR